MPHALCPLHILFIAKSPSRPLAPSPNYTLAFKAHKV